MTTITTAAATIICWCYAIFTLFYLLHWKNTRVHCTVCACQPIIKLMFQFWMRRWEREKKQLTQLGNINDKIMEFKCIIDGIKYVNYCCWKILSFTLIMNEEKNEKQTNMTRQIFTLHEFTNSKQNSDKFSVIPMDFEKRMVENNFIPAKISFHSHLVSFVIEEWAFVWLAS